MNKNKSSVVWLILLTAIVAITAVFGFAPRFSLGVSDFNSAASLIGLGFDYKSDGKPDYRSADYAVYSVSEYYVDYLGRYTDAEGNVVEEDDKVKMSEEDLKEAIAQTVEAIKARLEYLVAPQTSEYSVTVLDNNKIRVACSGIDISSASSLFDVVKERGNVSIKVAATEPTETTDFSIYPEVFEEDQYSFMQIIQDQNGFGVAFMLENNGAEALAKATYGATADKPVYLCVLVDGVLQGTANTITTPIQQTSQYFTYSSLADQNEAWYLGIYSLSEGYDLAFESEFTKVLSQGPAQGVNGASSVLIVLGIIAVVACVLFCVMYGFKGYAAIIALVACAVIAVFLMAFIPVTVFTVESFIGAIAGIIVAIVAQFIILRSVAAQNTGSAVDAAKDGHKASLMTLIDIHVVALIAAILVAVLVSELVGFAIAFIFTLIASAISSALISRLALILVAGARKAN